MATSASNLRLILDAVKYGRITPRRALFYARHAAAGEDISILAELAAPLGKSTERIDASGRRYTVPEPVVGGEILTPLATELLRILAGSGPAVGAPAATGEMTDAEADELYPPRTREAAERRHQRIEAAAQRIAGYSDDELFDAIFPYPGEEDVR
jgi:hypothetical protein